MNLTISDFLFTIAFFGILIFYVIVLIKNKKRTILVAEKQTKAQLHTNEVSYKMYRLAPGPLLVVPFIGDLYLLGGYDVPFEGFTALSKRYGACYRLTLGKTPCLVVNNLELIREVLNQNGKFFGGRPDFIRFHKLFGGDRNNSLALCDWSSLQQKRRNLARRHCSPRDFSSLHLKMNDVAAYEVDVFLNQLNNKMTPGEDFHMKPLLMATCMNMFSQYMCSTRFQYNDEEFNNTVRNFDKIFWEINQGYAIDFLPWLLPFYEKHMKKLATWSQDIRSFILTRIINDRELNIDVDEPETDFTDALLKSLIQDQTVDRDTIIFMLEDFLGGHSAVGNLVMLVLAYVVRNPSIAANIQEEIDKVTNHGEKKLTLQDANIMPYTIATISETLRYSSSPIVPHVATENAVIDNYGVEKGTIVFINNYELNTSPKYWVKPEEFNPDRFLEKTVIDIRTGNVVSKIATESLMNNNESENFKTVLRMKTNIPHFLPFSIGKRTCIGQNLVKGFSFILIANILQQYNVTADVEKLRTYKACVAVPPDTFSFKLTNRETKHFS